MQIRELCLPIAWTIVSSQKQGKASPSEIQREKSQFILRHTVRSLQRKVAGLGVATRSSEWVDYGE